MIRLRLFPKFFLYTLVLMLSIALVASGMIYLLAPVMTSEGATLIEDIPGMAPAALPRDEAITNAVLASLPYSISVCVVLSLLCAYFFSRAITNPVRHILETTTLMADLDKDAACRVRAGDEIGMLAEGINDLYRKLLSTIGLLQEEKNRVREAERQKVEFLRVASHELKTPVTALSAMLDNMVMGVGSYKDTGSYLPQCREQVDRLGKMINEILDSSRLDQKVGQESPQDFDAASMLTELCGQYGMIAQTTGQHFQASIPDTIPVRLPPKMFSKALSNILSNAVHYTLPGKTIRVYTAGRELIIENECEPIPPEHLNRIFEPFYRPDYARNREDGGNGLGLYIVASILEALQLPYSLLPVEAPLGMRFTISLSAKDFD